MARLDKNQKLTDRQEKFCNEYLIDLNATQAAIRAGYSKKTADRIGHENLSKLDIQERIQGLRQIIADNQQITPERVIKEFARIAFDVDPKTDKKLNYSDKNKALENIGKHLGIFEKDNSQKIQQFVLNIGKKCQ